MHIVYSIVYNEYCIVYAIMYIESPTKCHRIPNVAATKFQKSTNIKV